MFNKPGIIPPPGMIPPPQCNNPELHFPPQNNTGRLFSGNKPVAYIKDLLLLHNLVIKWLVGISDSFGIYGYTPLNENGKIDIKYIPYVDILNYVDSSLVKTIKNLHLSLLNLKTYRLMICPLTFDLLYTGYTAGLKIKGITLNNILDNLELLTTNGILFNDNESTYFVISLLNAKDEVLFTVHSSKITGNNPNIIMGDNRYCTLLIKDFHLESSKYIGNISIKIRLSSYFMKSSKFKVLITQHNSENPGDIIIWLSGPLFYCAGALPDLSETDIAAKIYVNGSMHTPEFKKVQGITYVTDGYILLSLANIKKLNADAIASGDKVKFESNITDEEYVFSLDDFSYDTDSNLDIRAIAKWKHRFKIKPEYLYPKLNIYVKLTIINGFGLSIRLWNNIQIRYNGLNAYINTLSNENETNGIVEAFDGNYILSLLTSYLENVLYLFNTLNTFLLSLYLQVVPNKGLAWPDYFNTKNVNYNTRYFKRIFLGDDTNIKKVWGGTFIFGNLTLLQFNKDDFNVKISVDDGATWLDLKHYKDSYEITLNDKVIKGALCLVLPYEDGLAVRFALPLDTCFNHNDIICFELSIKSTSSVLLTYIKLRNEDNTLEF